MVDGEERPGLLPCRVFVAERRGVLRAWCEATVGAFFGEQDHVEVGEHRRQATVGGEFGFLGLAFPASLALLVGLAFAERHRDDTGTGDDLQGAERLAVIVDEACLTQPAGLRREMRRHPLVGAASASLIAEDVVDRHRAKGSPSPAERVETILALLDSFVLQVGALLEAERREVSVDEWVLWVERDLPFTVEEARMMRAVFLASELLPDEMTENFPRPWRALYTIPAGRIGHGMPRHATQAKRVSAPELLATRLVQSDVRDVSSDVVAALAEWLHEHGSA